MYSILWATITNTKEKEKDKDEKVAAADIDFTKLYIGKLTKDAVSSFHREFCRVTQEFALFKNMLTALDTKNITQERLAIMLDIMQGNNLYTANGKYRMIGLGDVVG